MSRTHLLATALALATLAAPAFAQQRVYQWKDASGVTHYTDIPPTTQHSTRNIAAGDEGAAAPAADSKPTESPQCLNARANLLRLQSGDAVGIDNDGDGKPDRNLSTDERKAQQDLNAAAIKAYCRPGKS